VIRNGYEAYWAEESFPIVVVVYENDPEDFQAAVLDAIDVWNQTVGVQVFTPVRMNYLNQVPTGCGWIATIAVDELEFAGYWTGKFVGQTSQLCKGQISILKNVKPSNVFKVYVHELGHALGLAHDPGDKRSIMYPTVYTNAPQFIMPDDTLAVWTMTRGLFSSLPKGTRKRVQDTLADL